MSGAGQGKKEEKKNRGEMNKLSAYKSTPSTANASSLLSIDWNNSYLSTSEVHNKANRLQDAANTHREKERDLANKSLRNYHKRSKSKQRKTRRNTRRRS